MTSDEIMYALKRPFEEKQISWRVGSTNSEKTSGIALAYIDARDVMHRLDSIFGVCGWQNKHHESGGKTFCDIGLKIEGEWLWRSGGAGDSDIEAEKGAISDSFKRAAVLWGVGQYLYSLPSQWFDLTPAGRSYKLAGTPTLPKWATPLGYDEIMAKRARQKDGSTTLPKTGIWESMTEEKQRELQNVVDQVRNLIETDITLALGHLADVTDADEYTALWGRLDSREQSTIKKAQGAYK